MLAESDGVERTKAGSVVSVQTSPRFPEVARDPELCRGRLLCEGVEPDSRNRDPQKTQGPI